MSDYSLPGVQIINRHLDNAQCSKEGGSMFKSWEDVVQKGVFPTDWTPEQKNQLVVWHYTVCLSVDSTYQTFQGAGVSSQFTLSDKGDIYCSVNPDKNMAYHAGVSRFATFEKLNYYSMGIEHVNPGGNSMCVTVDGFAAPLQIEGDSGYWYPFSDAQFTSSMSLTAGLQKRYKIPGWYVVTHADVAIGRKSDVGPLWPYKKSFDEYGVGYWPTESHDVNPDSLKLDDGDYLSLIKSFGYNSDNNKSLVRAYQMHYSAGNISGELVDSTKKSVLRHVVGLHGYIDPITGDRYDFFHQKFSEWASINPEKASGFSEYFSV